MTVGGAETPWADAVKYNEIEKGKRRFENTVYP